MSTTKATRLREIIIGLLTNGEVRSLRDGRRDACDQRPGCSAGSASLRGGSARGAGPGAQRRDRGPICGGPNRCAVFSSMASSPSKRRARRDALAAPSALPYALVFYEAPHRLLDRLEDYGVVSLGPDREAIIAREIAAMFESFHRCTASLCCAEPG